MGLVVRFVLLDHYEHEPETYPSADVALAMCVLQSYVIMQSNVVHFHRDSCWHPVRGFMACVFATTGMCNILVVSCPESTLCMLVIASALVVLEWSLLARNAEDMDAYVYYSALWHAWIPAWYLSWLVVRPCVYQLGFLNVSF